MGVSARTIVGSSTLVQMYLEIVPSGSLEALPSSLTLSASPTTKFVPALATGARLLTTVICTVSLLKTSVGPLESVAVNSYVSISSFETFAAVNVGLTTLRGERVPAVGEPESSFHAYLISPPPPATLAPLSTTSFSLSTIKFAPASTVSGGSIFFMVILTISFLVTSAGPLESVTESSYTTTSSLPTRLAVNVGFSTSTRFSDPTSFEPLTTLQLYLRSSPPLTEAPSRIFEVPSLTTRSGPAVTEKACCTFLIVIVTSLDAVFGVGELSVTVN